MAAIEFNYADFLAAFPAFASPTTYPEALLSGYFTDGTFLISDVNYGSLRDASRQRAINLLTAHFAQLGNMIATGEDVQIVQSASIDRVSVSLLVPPSQSQWQWWMNLTPYGQQLLALLSLKGAGGLYIGGRAEGSAFRKARGRF